MPYKPNRVYRIAANRKRSRAFAQRPVIIQQAPSRRYDWIQVIVTVLPGLAAVIALIFTYMTIQSTNQGQITDRFNAAVTNLGSTAEEVRIGGIYALQRIMQDSPRDQPAVIQILTAYIRDRAPAKEPKSLSPPLAPSANNVASIFGPKPSADIQAALTVLGTRDASNDDGVVIDLSGTDLEGADFTGDQFQNADFTQANLAGAKFFSVNFNAANFQVANLSNSIFHNADLANAFLSKADVSYAFFISGDNLGNAVLDNADLESARLSGANLTGASMRHADLKGATVSGAEGLSDSAPGR